MSIGERLFYSVTSIIMIPIFCMFGILLAIFGFILPIWILVSPESVLKKTFDKKE